MTTTITLNSTAARVLRPFIRFNDRPWTDQEISAYCVELDPAWATPWIDSLLCLGRLVVVGHKIIDGQLTRLVRLNKEYSHA